MNIFLVYGIYGLIGAVSAFSMSRHMGMKGKLDFVFTIAASTLTMGLAYKSKFTEVLFEPALAIGTTPNLYTVGCAITMIGVLMLPIVIVWNVMVKEKVIT